MKWFTALKYLVLVTPILVSGCGGSSSSDSDDDDVASETGVFIDSAVGGIDYRTQTLSGRTNAAGEYEYEDGETVIFSVGDFDFPPVTAGEIITPLDIFETQDISNSAVLNMARLLQSLDTDGDPSNGISIGEMAHMSAAGLIVSFSSATFEDDVSNLVANSGSVTTDLISAGAALAHLQDSLASLGLRGLIGSWYIDGTLLTFVDDDEYFVTKDAGDTDIDCADGMEYGTYTWNRNSGSLVLENMIDTTLGCGFASIQGETYAATAVIAGDTLTITDEEGNIPLARVTDANNPLIGSWYVEGGNKSLLTFIDNTRYFVTQDVNENGCMDGVEFGTYTLDSEGLDMTSEVDTTGPCGFTENPAETFNATAAIDSNILTLDDGIEDPIPLAAVK